MSTIILDLKQSSYILTIMSRKQRPVEAGDPPNDEAFVEAPPPEENPSRPSGRPIKMKVADGQIDWDAIPEERRDEIVESLANDEKVLEKIASMSGEGGEGEVVQSKITVDHANTLLDAISWVEKKFLPPMMHKILQSQAPLGFKVPPFNGEVVDQAFSFSDMQRSALAPGLAELGEKKLPERVKDWIANLGLADDYKILGVLAWTVKGQISTMVELQKEQWKADGISRQQSPEAPPPTGGKVQ